MGPGASNLSVGVDATGTAGAVNIMPGGNLPAKAAPSNSAEKRDRVTYFGVAPEPVSEELRDQLPLRRGEGILVGAVVIDSPAAQAGIHLHDILLRFDDQILVEPGQLKALVQMRNPGEKVKLTLMRKGVQQAVEVTLAQTEDGGNKDCVPGVDFKIDGIEKLLRGLKNVPGAVIDRKATVIGADGKTQTFEGKDMDKIIDIVRQNIGQGLPKEVDSLLKFLGETDKKAGKSHAPAPQAK